MTTATRRTGRSALALLAGFVVTAGLSLGTDVVMHAAHVFPPWGQPMSDALFAWATTYRLVYTTLGSYATARVAPYAPMGHALFGGALGMLLATAGAVATWNNGPAFGPHWYPIALVVTALPCAWAGARLESALVARGDTVIPKEDNDARNKI